MAASPSKWVVILGKRKQASLGDRIEELMTRDELGSPPHNTDGLSSKRINRSEIEPKTRLTTWLDHSIGSFIGYIMLAENVLSVRMKMCETEA